jgi:endonuclease YncB( thermonuclease family)
MTRPLFLTNVHISCRDDRMALARLFGCNGQQIRRVRAGMGQPDQLAFRLRAALQAIDPLARFVFGRARARALVGALALISATSPALLLAQGVSSPQPAAGVRPEPVANADRARSAGCDGPVVTTGRVRSVVDGRTFVLEDGREVRLAALEVAPVAAPAEQGQERDRAGRAAQSALSEIVLGRDVVLRQAAPMRDRYGRIVAFASVARDGAERSLQHELVANGHARLSARIEETACLGELRASERAARGAALGLWADPDYSVQRAEKPAEIATRRGRFTVIEGEVVSVRESGGTTYVNFGRRWSESFTAVILKRNAAALLAAGLDPKRLKGRRVEVRGFVELRGGPRIEVTRPEQVAIVAGR